MNWELLGGIIGMAFVLWLLYWTYRRQLSKKELKEQKNRKSPTNATKSISLNKL